MKKIVVSCAPSGTGSGSNMGMNTVDYAIHNIVNELDKKDDIILAKPWPAYLKKDDGKYPRGYEYDVFPTVFNYDHRQLGGKVDKSLVLYWGDFQQGNDYVMQTAKRLHQLSPKLEAKVIPYEECIDICKDYFLLRQHYKKDELPFTISSFGCTLFQNGIRDYSDVEYYNNLKWFYKHAEYVKAREPYSGFTISQLKDNYSENYWGVDASLLNRKEELLALKKNQPEGFKKFDGAIGFFLGRSSSSFPKWAFFNFLNKLAARNKSNIVKIPWAGFGEGLFATKQDYWAKLILRNYTPVKDEYMAGDILYGMSKLSLVVTDTYHVALNCIALDIPVICIYEPFLNQNRNANMGYIESWRDKRALFFMSYNLSDFMMPIQGLLNKKYLDKKVDHIFSLLNEKSWLKLAYEPIHKVAQANREEVKSLLLKYSSIQ